MTFQRFVSLKLPEFFPPLYLRRTKDHAEIREKFFALVPKFAFSCRPLLRAEPASQAETFFHMSCRYFAVALTFLEGMQGNKAFSPSRIEGIQNDAEILQAFSAVFSKSAFPIQIPLSRKPTAQGQQPFLMALRHIAVMLARFICLQRSEILVPTGADFIEALDHHTSLKNLQAQGRPKHGDNLAKAGFVVASRAALLLSQFPDNVGENLVLLLHGHQHIPEILEISALHRVFERLFPLHFQ